MHIHPQIAALRRDGAPMWQAQAAMIAAVDHWRAGDAVAAVIAEMPRFEQGAELADCPALAALFAPGGTAAGALVDSLMATMLGGLDAHPLGHVALRHATDGVISTLQLAQSGMAALTLVATDGAGLARAAAPKSISYAPGEAWERVLAGSAEAELVRCPPGAGPIEKAPARLERGAMPLRPGVSIARDSRHEAMLLHRVEGRLVTLRLNRRQDGRDPVREYSLATGELLHLSAASPAESRWELMVALLGRMGRADAAPLLARMALGRDSAALRWQALRECLGLDTAAGYAALCTLARDAADPLYAPAGALRAQLLESWPQLAGLEAEAA